MSHQEVKSVESNGNDRADAIANDYRKAGEVADPEPYFTLAEEHIIFQHHGNNMQGDVRVMLKTIEKQRMLEIWLAKTKVQSKWIRK